MPVYTYVGNVDPGNNSYLFHHKGAKVLLGQQVRLTEDDAEELGERAILELVASEEDPVNPITLEERIELLEAAGPGGTGEVTQAELDAEIARAIAAEAALDGRLDIVEGAGGHTIQDDGTPVPDRDTMDYVGAGVSVSDNGTKTIIFVPGATSVEEEPVPLRERLWLPTGAKGQNVDRGQALGSQNPLNSGRLSLFGGAAIPAGETCSSVTFLAGTTAANAPTNQWAVLVRASDNAILAKSADAGAAAWAANAAKTFAFTTPYVATEDIAVKLGLVVVAGTVPTLQSVNSNSNVVGVAPSMSQIANTGLTDPASLVTISGVANSNFVAYCYWS